MPKKKKVENEILKHMEEDIVDLSVQELKELLLINTYKLAVVRSQLEVLTNILINKDITTYEEVWKQTNSILKKSKM